MMHFNNKRATPHSSLYGAQWNPPRYNKTPSKVVSIPVHFMGSERTRTDSATKIQKVARGFLVRKSLKKMLKMKVELEEIEKKVNNEETVKMIKKEQKERLRISETIMNLLLRLDSVRVFHCCYALRDLRKSLIKRAIVLQEFVDQIQMVGPTDVVEENCLEKEEVGCEEENEGGRKIEALVNEKDEDGKKIEGLVNEDDEGKCVVEEVNCMEKEERGCEEEDEGGEKLESLVNEEKIEDGVEGKCVKDEENCLMKEKDEEGEYEDEEKMEEEEKEESVGTSLVEEGIEEDYVVVKEEDEEENCYKQGDVGNREILKRMMEENEKMMEMMAQLFERNEKQTTLLTSLTQRVEQLERAFTCDKLRRKNKKRRYVDAKHRHNGCI